MHRIFMLSWKTSHPPHNCTMLRFIFCLPDVTRTLHLAVFGGQGILKTIFVAIKSLLKLDIAFTLKTAVDPPLLLNYWDDAKRQLNIFSDSVCHQVKLSIWGYKGNSPVCVEFSSLTQRWKVQSSISTARPARLPFPPDAPPCLSITSLSFSPNLHSGIPVK